MKKNWLVIGMAMVAVVFSGLAEGQHEHEEECCEEVVIFDRNIRLDFKMVPAEEDARELFIITATSWFETNVNVEGGGGEVEFGIEGRLELLDSGGIFLEFEAGTRMENDDNEAEFFTASGVLLTFGKETGIARLGEKTLMIKVTYVE